MYEFFIGLGIGFVETVKVGVNLAGSAIEFIGELVKGSTEIYKELDE